MNNWFVSVTTEHKENVCTVRRAGYKDEWKRDKLSKIKAILDEDLCIKIFHEWN
jgi:hypothetical protein